MTYKNFEDFLQKHYGGMGSHKDPDVDLDKFDNWLQQLDVQEFIDYADLYAEEVKNK